MLKNVFRESNNVPKLAGCELAGCELRIEIVYFALQKHDNTITPQHHNTSTHQHINMSKEITSRSEDYSKWYNDIVKKANLASHSAVSPGKSLVVVGIKVSVPIGVIGEFGSSGSSVE